MITLDNNGNTGIEKIPVNQYISLSKSSPTAVVNVDTDNHNLFHITMGITIPKGALMGYYVQGEKRTDEYTRDDFPTCFSFTSRYSSFPILTVCPDSVQSEPDYPGSGIGVYIGNLICAANLKNSGWELTFFLDAQLQSYLENNEILIYNINLYIEE